MSTSGPFTRSVARPKRLLKIALRVLTVLLPTQMPRILFESMPLLLKQKSEILISELGEVLRLSLPCEPRRTLCGVTSEPLRNREWRPLPPPPRQRARAATVRAALFSTLVSILPCLNSSGSIARIALLDGPGQGGSTVLSARVILMPSPHPVVSRNPVDRTPPLPDPRFIMNLSEDHVRQITDCLLAGQKIQAIKLYREATGEGQGGQGVHRVPHRNAPRETSGQVSLHQGRLHVDDRPRLDCRGTDRNNNGLPPRVAERSFTAPSSSFERSLC